MRKSVLSLVSVSACAAMLVGCSSGNDLKDGTYKSDEGAFPSVKVEDDSFTMKGNGAEMSGSIDKDKHEFVVEDADAGAAGEGFLGALSGAQSRDDASVGERVSYEVKDGNLVIDGVTFDKVDD